MTLSFQTASVYQTSKCFVTYGTMSRPDLKQLPSTGKPWSSLLAQDFIHKVDLIIPSDAAQRLMGRLAAWQSAPPAFHRVIMTLGQVLEGDFFTQYIKIGNIMMLSEGGIGSENVFSLKDGVLTMYLDKETYERAGLVGKPHGVKGKRGQKPRWIVQYDLRGSSALHGKKGFDRLIYACKNALNSPTTWLFCNFGKTPDPDPLTPFYPTKYTSRPGIVEGLHVKAPSLSPPPEILEASGRTDLEEYATEMYEWLSLIRLESPRVEFDDKVDPYLCRYELPGAPDTPGEAILSKITWRGFLSPGWAREILAETILALSSRPWFSLSVTCFSTGVVANSTESTILKPPNSSGDYISWEIKEHDG